MIFRINVRKCRSFKYEKLLDDFKKLRGTVIFCWNFHKMLYITYYFNEKENWNIFSQVGEKIEKAANYEK